MRLLFVITGFGFGDTIRASAIIDEFMKRDKRNKVAILGYDHSYKFFKNKFPTLKVVGYDFPDRNMRFITPLFMMRNVFLPVNWFLTLRKYKNFLKKFNPDFVISDFEPSAILIANSLNKKCFTIFSFDPKAYASFPNKNIKHKIQAAFIENIYKASYKVLIPTFLKRSSYSNVIYINPIVRSKKLHPRKKLLRYLKLKKSPIVVMLGGSDFGLELGRKILAYSRRSKENFIFFGGSKKISRKHFLFKENYLRYLKASKCVISLAGNLTISECLHYKKPLLLFPVKDHVEQQLNAFLAKDFAIVGSYKDVNNSIRRFLSSLNILKNNVPKVKANGAKQVVDVLYKEKRK